MPAADGKNRSTDVADIEQLLRIIQSIPSKKAEPLKQWLAKVGSERLDQVSPNKASDYIKPIEDAQSQELPFDEDK